MSSTFPTKLADDYVPAAYARSHGEDAVAAPTSQFPPEGGPDLIAFRSGRHLLAVTVLSGQE